MDDFDLNEVPPTMDEMDFNDVHRNLFGDSDIGSASWTGNPIDLNQGSDDVVNDHVDQHLVVADNHSLSNETEEVDDDRDIATTGALVPVDNEIRSNYVDDDLPYTVEEIMKGPKHGMIFDTIDLLFNFYMAHGKANGFAITKRSHRKSCDDGAPPLYIYLCCDKGRGRRGAKQSKRCECKARLSAKLREDSKYEINLVSHEYNHELDPGSSRFMPGHRNVSKAMKRCLEANDLTGIRIAKNIRMEEMHAGGPDQLGCLPQDCRNFINATRRLNLEEGDAESMRKFFLDMQQRDRDFFHLMDVDVSGRLRNVIWIHPQSKAAYVDFHDVVCFDSTYLLNRYRMPFASFVGVNHHRQSILLGCALVCHEDVETYRWLFRTWLTAMGGVQPIGMLTDQYESIKVALQEEMPDTIHRFCVWHIFTKIPMKLKNVHGGYKEAKSEFQSLVLDSLMREEFETRWDIFMETHRLRANDWLRKLYIESQQWAPVYLHHFFWAGMKSTQRSEGMHAFFDGYLGVRSSLSTFVSQYEVALRSKHEKELLAEHRSKYTQIACETGYAWERQLSKVLTHSVFKLVQFEVRKILHCEITSNEITQVAEFFHVRDTSVASNYYRNAYTYTVEFWGARNYFECNCKRFESMGILCCHILKVMIIKEVSRIPEWYILRRWRIDVSRTHLRKFLAGGYPCMSKEYKAYQEQVKYFEGIMDIAMDDMSKMGYVNAVMTALKHDLVIWETSFETPYVSNLGNRSDSVQEESTPIRDPPRVRSRGRPRMGRYPSSYDYFVRGIGRGSGRGVARGGGAGSNANVGRGGARGGGAGSNANVGRGGARGGAARSSANVGRGVGGNRI